MTTRRFRLPPLLLFALFSTIALLVTLIGIHSAYRWFHLRPQMTVLRMREQDGLDRHAYILRNTIREVLADLHLLAALEEAERVDDRLTITPDLVSAFTAVSLHKNLYDQIRILDPRGMERLRIDQERPGLRPERVPEDQLQNKSGRYYVLETLDLPANAVFMSPLDLNVENGAVERPFNPVIRFGHPLTRIDGTPIGLILINYRARRLLESLDRIAGHRPGALMLVNENGHWLKGPSPDVEWSFMFPEEDRETFATRHADAWKRMTEQPDGQFMTPAGLFTFTTLRPNRPGLHHLKGTGDVIGRSLSPPARSRSWKLVSLVPTAALESRGRAFLKIAILTGGGIYLLLVIGCGLLTRSIVRKQQAEAALVAAHGDLERQVALQTEDLRETNLALNRKIVELERERARTEEAQTRLRLSQKLEAMGRMAGGIAHDFNNILTAILWQSEQMRDSLPASTRDGEGIRIVHDAALRARDLVRRILTFSKNEQIKREPIRLQPVCEETLKLLSSSLPANIRMDAHIDPDCGHVLGNTTQIHQIITNLVTNAVHAMESVPDGVLTVRLDEAESGAILTIRDTGTGIPDGVKERIFDPYFTTKGAEKGTGIGLSMVHAIVRQHDGEIRVDSPPEGGCLFTLTFPLIHPADDLAVTT